MTFMRLSKIAVPVAVTALLLASTLSAAQTPAVAGQWEGSIAGQIPLVVRLDVSATGAWSGTYDVVSQGLLAGALTAIAVDGRSVRFSLVGPPGNPLFAGTLAEDGASITGEFSQGGARLPLTLRRAERTALPKRPQTPQGPFPYDATDVTVTTPTPEVTLAGTLTTPRTPGPHTAVVLLSGSGPQDRDSTIAGHKPFLVLADHLTRHGIAVLRLDDRGVGGSTRGATPATGDDLAADAIAALDFLRTRAGINPSRVGLIGHSEGATIAPLAATRTKNVAFLVLLSGPGVTGEQVMYEQAALIGRAAGVANEAITANRLLQERVFDIVRNESDEAVRRERIRTLTNDAVAQQYSSPAFRFLATFDPATSLRQITVPTLVLGGERDLQVSPTQNLAPIEAALRAAGNKEFTIRLFPKLNHLLQTAETGSPAEYAVIEETMAPAVLEAIADWVGRR